VPVKDTAIEKAFLNLLTADGLASIALDDVPRIRFLRPELDAELKLALSTLAQGHDTQKKTVAIRFTGDGKRRVRTAYIAESPIWKTSYRLVLGEGDGAPWLQGWAIVENTTDEDWKEVKLTLVSGRPISFVMDLYQPLYVVRPEMRLKLYESLKAKRYEEAMEMLAESEDAPAEGGPDKDAGIVMERKRAGRALAPGAAAAEPQTGGIGRGGAASATGGEVGELFRYEIDAPVTLPRQKSAMLKIVSAEVAGTKVSIYDERVHAKHPLNGLKLKNTTGLHLMQGPITVFDDSAYAGDAQIQDLPPGTERLIAYAMDLDTEVAPTQKEDARRLTSVKIAKGTLHTSHKYARTKSFTVKNSGKKATKLLVEHPIQQPWTLVEPKEPAEKTRGQYRFLVNAEPGKPATLDVKEEYTQSEQVAITNIDDGTIAYFLNQPVTSEEVKKALREVIARKAAIQQVVQRRLEMERQIVVIDQEQKRIRDNMAQLAKEGDLYRKYVTKLTEQEDLNDNFRKQVTDAIAEEQKLKKALDDYLLGLEIA
jgi:hypothetical protein